jgi:hypothetical protein
MLFERQLLDSDDVALWPQRLDVHQLSTRKHLRERRLHLV